MWLWTLLLKLVSLVYNRNNRIDNGLPNAGKQEQITADIAANKLKTNIAKKGDNAYYYAHKNTNSAAAIVRNEPPKLLETVKTTVIAVGGGTQFDTFAWADSTKTVSVYIPFPQAESVDDSQIKITSEQLSFRFELIHDTNQFWLVKPKLHGTIQSATWKKKKDKFVITLQKKDVKVWHRLEQ